MVGARLRQLREIQTSPLLHGVRPAAPTTGGSFHFVRPILTSVQNSHRDDLPTDGELKPPKKNTDDWFRKPHLKKKKQKLGPEKKKQVQKIPSPTSPENMFITRPGRRAFFLGSKMDPDVPISHNIS